MVQGEEILVFYLLNLPWLDQDVKDCQAGDSHLGAARDGMKFDLAQVKK